MKKLEKNFIIIWGGTLLLFFIYLKIICKYNVSLLLLKMSLLKTFVFFCSTLIMLFLFLFSFKKLLLIKKNVKSGKGEILLFKTIILPIITVHDELFNKSKMYRKALHTLIIFLVYYAKKVSCSIRLDNLIFFINLVSKVILIIILQIEILKYKKLMVFYFALPIFGSITLLIFIFAKILQKYCIWYITQLKENFVIELDNDKGTLCMDGYFNNYCSNNFMDNYWCVVIVKKPNKFLVTELNLNDIKHLLEYYIFPANYYLLVVCSEYLKIRFNIVNLVFRLLLFVSFALICFTVLVPTQLLIINFGT